MLHHSPAYPQLTDIHPPQADSPSSRGTVDKIRPDGRRADVTPPWTSCLVVNCERLALSFTGRTPRSVGRMDVSTYGAKPGCPRAVQHAVKLCRRRRTKPTAQGKPSKVLGWRRAITHRRSAVLSPAGTEDTEGQEAKEGVSYDAREVPVKPAGGLTGTGPSRRHPKCRFCGRLHGCQRSSTRGSAVGTVDKHDQI